MKHETEEETLGHKVPHIQILWTR